MGCSLISVGRDIGGKDSQLCLLWPAGLPALEGDPPLPSPPWCTPTSSVSGTTEMSAPIHVGLDPVLAWGHPGP